jgi:hypothetical protein
MQLNGRVFSALRAARRGLSGESRRSRVREERSGVRTAGMAVVAAGVFLVVTAFAPLGAGATQGTPEHKITLCHATDSRSNPYVEVTVDVASTQFQGHAGHDGPIFSPDLPDHTKWGDIIPPFDFGAAGSYAGKNWTAAGQAIWNAGCTVVIPTTTTTTAPTTSTTEAPTTSTTEAPTTSTTEAPTTSTTEAPTTSTTAAPTTSTTDPATSTTAPNDPSTSTTIAGETSTSTTKPSTVTTEGTASTTAPASSTTVGAAKAAHGTTTTTDPGSARATRVARGQLPFTGGAPLPAAIAGVALVGFGSALAMSRRRRVS